MNIFLKAEDLIFHEDIEDTLGDETVCEYFLDRDVKHTLENFVYGVDPDRYGNSYSMVIVKHDMNERGCYVVFPRMKIINGNVVLGQDRLLERYKPLNYSEDEEEYSQKFKKSDKCEYRAIYMPSIVNGIDCIFHIKKEEIRIYDLPLNHN